MAQSVFLHLETVSSTVESPIMDSPKREQPLYNGHKPWHRLKLPYKKLSLQRTLLISGRQTAILPNEEKMPLIVDKPEATPSNQNLL